jgi:hypothetical protein
MKRSSMFVCALLRAAALPAEAQVRGGAQRPGQTAEVRDSARHVVLSAYPLMYTGFGTFFDPGTQSRWLLADAALGGGGSVHVEVAGGVLLGVDGTFARTNYERRPRQGQTALDAGRASVTTLAAGGRVSGGGLGRLGGLPGMRGMGGLMGLGRLGYLSGGVGAVIYDLENVDGSNADLAFNLGGGLEFLSARGRGGFLELKQIWAFHEREGVDDSTVRHSRLELGARIALRR